MTATKFDKIYVAPPLEYEWDRLDQWVKHLTDAAYEGDEAEIQAKVYRIILDAEKYGFKLKVEETYYLERSFTDYVNLIETFVDDPLRKAQIIADAKKITEELSRENNIRFEDFRYKSICRMNILEKV